MTAKVGGDRSRSRSRRKRKKRDREKDTPHFEWTKGMTLGPEQRYRVDQLLGDGTFGRVLACHDTAKDNACVAVKVVKGVKRYCEHAEDEADVLKEIHRLDTKRESHCVQLLDAFVHPRHHFCLVTEALATSIRDFLKANKSRGLYVHDASTIARQLLQGLAFLHRIELTHTDLKCRNLMLRDGAFDVEPHPRMSGMTTRRPRNCDVVLIDFGGAVFADERHGGRAGTRQFRAPEIVLGMPWDESSDIWSAGCIIAMLYLGQRPFSVHEDMEHLAMMERLLEVEFPAKMALEATASEDLPDGIKFDAQGRLLWPECAPEEDAIDRVKALRPLREQIAEPDKTYLSLVQELLRIDPRQRVSASAALRSREFLGRFGGE